MQRIELLEDHLEIYVQLKYGHHYTQLFTAKELVIKVNAYYSVGFKDKDELLKIFTGIGKPKTYQVVHRLFEKGFSPKTIGKWLDISQSTISIHLSKTDNQIKEYKNYKLIEYLNHKMFMLQNFNNEY